MFNRSYYEEVLVVRVHPELLERQGLPKERIRPKIWQERFEDINAFEQHLWRSGTTVVKFFLNISRREQEKRLLARIDDPSKNWKFSAGGSAGAGAMERLTWRRTKRCCRPPAQHTRRGMSFLPIISGLRTRPSRRFSTTRCPPGPPISVPDRGAAGESWWAPAARSRGRARPDVGGSTLRTLLLLALGGLLSGRSHRARQKGQRLQGARRSERLSGRRRGDLRELAWRRRRPC